MSIRAKDNGVVNTPNLFSGLDTPDSVALRIGANLHIHGWLFSFDATIDDVYIECNGKRYTADYPVKRPHVGDAKGAWMNACAKFPQTPYATDLHCDVDPPYNFGFVTGPIVLNAETEQFADINLIAIVNGCEFIVQSKHIELAWSNPEEELLNSGAIAPFKCPAEFNPQRLLALDNCTPVFLLGRKSAMQRISCAVEDQGITVSCATTFAQMRDVIVTCYDTYFEFYLLYFKSLEGQRNACAFGKFDIYGVLNAVIASFHQQLLEMSSEFVHAMLDENDIDLIPLLQTIYPRSIFVHVREQIEQSEAHAQSPKLHFDAKLRVLHHGRAPIKLQDVEIGEIGDLASDLRAADQLLKLIRHSCNTADGQINGAHEQADSVKDHCHVTHQTYLQLLPSYDKHQPIFILGAGRSGTSAMTAALKKAGIAGFGEGHVFPLIDEIARRLWELPSLRAAQGDSQKNVCAQTIHTVVDTSFQQTYGHLGSAIWLDKTPDHLMINCIPLLTAMFPEAQFLFLHRHPIAVAESRKRKFGSTPFFAILEWNECIKAWNKHKELLGQADHLECDANELRSDQLHRRLSDFLKLDKQSSETIGEYLSVQTPEMTRHFPQEALQAIYAGMDENRRFAFDALLLPTLEKLDVYVEDTDWNADTIAWVKNALGTLPEQFGYVIHRPKTLLIDSMVALVKQIDQHKHEAACSDVAATHWKEQHAHQLAHATYWESQCRHQIAIAARWKKQHDQLQDAQSEKSPPSWLRGVKDGFRNRFGYFRKP